MIFGSFGTHMSANSAMHAEQLASSDDESSGDSREEQTLAQVAAELRRQKRSIPADGVEQPEVERSGRKSGRGPPCHSGCA